MRRESQEQAPSPTVVPPPVEPPRPLTPSRIIGECSVCFDAIGHNEPDTITLDCNHVYHIDCIFGWVHRQNRTCPTCRAHISSEQIRRIDPVFAQKRRLDELLFTEIIIPLPPDNFPFVISEDFVDEEALESMKRHIEQRLNKIRSLKDNIQKTELRMQQLAAKRGFT